MNRSVLAGVCAAMLSAPAAESAGPASWKFDAGRGVADRVISRVRHEDPVWGNYGIDLTFDAVLELYLATGEVKYRDYVFAAMFRRNIKLEDPVSYKAQPFGHLTYNLYRASGDKRIGAAFVAESRKYFAEVDRAPDGLVLHRMGKGEPPRVLIDSMQDYVSRMARTGLMTGEKTFYAEAAEQVRLHGDLLRLPENGLWRQGRGWEPADPQALSPGAWSRGQGWVLRGLTDTLDALPKDSAEYASVRATTASLIDALLPLQNREGMWHCLPHLPQADSWPETSGTALIAAAIYRCLNGGHLEGAHYAEAAHRAFAAISERVGADGRVFSACIGPGSLNQSYLDARYFRKKFAEIEDHGWFAVLYACAAREKFFRAR